MSIRLRQLIRLLRPAMILLLGLLGCQGPALRAAEVPAPRVALITIDHMIDDSQVYYLTRALADAQHAGVATVLIHFRTDGGLVDSARTMLGLLLALPQDHRPRLVGYVDNRCYSAGALIAYGCDQIYLAPNATIGDIGVIDITDKGPEFATEKFETVVRTLERSAAQARGWDPAKLQKMTARNQELDRFQVSGRSQYVLEDDLPSFLQDHPKLDPASKVLVSPRDRLLSYTASDALTEGMATGLAGSLGELYQKLGVEPGQVIDLHPTTTEVTAWKLSGFAMYFAALAVLCVIGEFKIGGHGLFLILAGVLGAAFLVCQYYQQLAGYPEILLMLIGVLLILLELFIFPASGWLLALGITSALCGLLLAFMPDAQQFHPASVGWSDQLLHGLRQSLLAVVVVFVGLLLLIAGLPHSPAMRRLVVHKAVDGTSAPLVERDGSLIGRTGHTRSELRPTGAVVIDGHDWSATSEHGEFIPAGVAVAVVGMRYGETIVRRLARPGEGA
jgi:membrane-bound serine protease (ClpP class)